MIEETKSNWKCVTNLLKGKRSLTFSKKVTDFFSGEFLSILAQYKFVSKLITSGSNVLDIGFGEGLCSYLLSKEGHKVHGIVSNEEAYTLASLNFSHENLTFSCGEASIGQEHRYTHIVCLQPMQLLTPFYIDRSLMPHLETHAEQGLLFLSIQNKDPHYPLVEEYLKNQFVFYWKFEVNGQVIQVNRVPSSPSQLLLVAGKRKR